MSLALVLALCLGLLPAAYAGTAGGPAVSSNKNRQDYSSYYASTVKSHLYENPSHGLTRVEYTGKEIVVEDYDSAFQLQASRTIPMELSVWGGFYAGADYNFFVFGQNNPGESDSVEVFRIVKYSKDWQRLGQASIKGANTTHPFDAGSLRCDEYNGYLYIRTCHEMYKSSDGLNHQANVTIAVDQDSMAVTDSYYDVMNQSYGYVSHSFNQYIIVDEDGHIVAIDHGDAYPRGVAFCKYYADAGTGRFRGAGYGAWCSYANLFQFAGATGQNATGASIGGLAETRDSYVFCYNYDGKGGNGDRYMYYHWMDKASGKSWSAQITETPGSTTPVLASLGLDGGYMLWNGKSGYTANDTLYYLHYGADGKPEQYQIAKGSLSDCQPVAYNGKVVWYVTDNSAPVFYTLDASGVRGVPAGGSAQPEPPTEPDPPTEPEKPGAALDGIMSNPMRTYSNATVNSYVRTDGALIEGSTVKSTGNLAFTYEGGGHYLLLKEDGTLWGREAPDSGQPAPALVKVLDNVVQIQPGMALKRDGSVWTNRPLLSDGSIYRPNTMYKLMDGVKQIYSLNTCYEGMAVKTDGSLWTWGFYCDAAAGQTNPWLGREVSVSDDWYAPAKVMDDVAYATATMAIKTDGTLWSWGNNSFGAVGNGSELLQPTPVKILDNVVGAWCGYGPAGEVQKFALLADGSLYSWGINREGSLGYEGGNKTGIYYDMGYSGSVPYQDTPRKTTITGVVNVSPYYNEPMALTADGTVWAIGPSGLDRELVDGVKVLPGWPNAGSTQPTDPEEPYKPTSPDFNDVPAGEWYAAAVSWAVARDITNGTGGGKFSPGQNCTHAQILTFLYRASRGEGAATAADMDKAVQWARGKGMIGGGFNGGKACTRAEAVSYIWQALGKEPAPASSFTDVPTGADYAAAVSWAVANGVTNGTNAEGTTFSPGEICTRGHIVTFLHRAYVPEARLK